TAPTTRADPADGTGQGGSAVAPGPDGLVVGPLDPRGQLLVDRDRAVGVEHLRAGGRPLPRQVPLAAVDVGPHALVDGAGLVGPDGLGVPPDLGAVVDARVVDPRPDAALAPRDLRADHVALDDRRVEEDVPEGLV